MLNRRLLILCGALILTTVSFSSFAKDQLVSIKLTKIEAVKTTERFGDELYFSISQYGNKETPQLFRVPMFPLHWLSRELPQVKNVKLWEGKLSNGQATLLIFSLLEQDLEPWNSDEHIGSVQVKLLNKNGKIISQWGQPKFHDQPEVQQPNPKVPSYILLGDGGRYKVAFKLEVR